MGSLGFPELIVIFVIALIIFGPRKLPEIGRSLGKGLAEFKKASNDLRSTLEEEIRLDETRSQLEASRAAQAAQDAQAAAALQAQVSTITETPAGVEDVVSGTSRRVPETNHPCAAGRRG